MFIQDYLFILLLLVNGTEHVQQMDTDHYAADCTWTALCCVSKCHLRCGECTIPCSGLLLVKVQLD